jgi:succinate dehydrogenase / fumarate reductase, cytochrome b subunit
MTAAAPRIHRAIGFYEASLGKKVLMAVTGTILFAYVVGHLLGNLQIYSADHDLINRYAAFLHAPNTEGLLWLVRAVLFLCVVLHIIAALQLWFLKRAARPIGYVKKDDVPTAYAARTMMWSGPIIAAYVIFHILHLTTGSVLPLQELGPNRPNVRFNVISGFQHPAVAGFYIFALLLLCMHLYHGLWSMFQSVGINQPRYTPALKRCAAVIAIGIAAGYISIPVAVLTGLLTY